MEDTETPGMHIYGESKTTRTVMATVPHVTSDSGLRKFQADGFLFHRVQDFIVVVKHCLNLLIYILILILNTEVGPGVA